MRSRPILMFGRLCARSGAAWPSSATPAFLASTSRFFSKAPRFNFRAFRVPVRPSASPFPRHGLKASAGAGAAALGTAVFVDLSEKNNDGTEQTAEGRMLEVSREELTKTIAPTEHGLLRLSHQLLLLVDRYLWEPLCTGVRFLHLVFIFVPVIVTVPAIWFGPRRPSRSNERSGTIWWYGFLVSSMEWAGPAFIKVSPCRSALCAASATTDTSRP